MSCWTIPAIRIDAGTLLLSDALLRLAGLLAVLPALVSSQLPLSTPLFLSAAAWSIVDYRRQARRIGGRALHRDGDAWCWIDHGNSGGAGCREPLLIAAGFGGRTLLRLQLVGKRERYQLVVLLPLLSHECRRRMLLALRYGGDSTVSTASGARSG